LEVETKKGLPKKRMRDTVPPEEPPEKLPCYKSKTEMVLQNKSTMDGLQQQHAIQPNKHHRRNTTIL
jgi:hypothetical protein